MQRKVIWFRLKMMKLNEKKFLTISKRCCKIHIAVAKSDKKQNVKAKSFLLVRKQEIKKISKVLFFERLQKIK
ncbi:hypothetical protein DWZ63_15280 [Clostridium sp. AF34-13]|nr:hypothetical protein DWZ63_15280 [Clostridium sp. AF34-13]